MGNVHRAGSAAREHVANLVLRHSTSTRVVPRALRASVLRRAGMSVGRSSIEEGVWFGSAQVSIGDGSYIGPGCFLDAFAPITIGDRVSLAPRVSLITSTHQIGPAEQRAGALSGRPVVVEDGAWLGAGCTVLPGVRIGHGTVVAAGAVVTGDTEPDTVYAGVPAKPVRRLAAG